MHVNPVFEYEMKKNMRSIKGSWIIFIVNLILAIIGIVAYFGGGGEEMYLTSGQYYFPMQSYMMMSYVIFLMICLIVPGISGGAVSMERERRTLDLLLVTYLTPWKIIVGKLEAVLGMVLLISVSALPVLSLVMIYGGINVADLFFLVVMLVASGIFIGSISIMCSALIKKTVTATIVSYIIMIFLTVGMFVIFLWMQSAWVNGVSGVVEGEFESSSFWLFFLAVNPLIVYYGMLRWQTGIGHGIEQISTFFSGKTGGLMVDHMLTVSVVVQCVLSVVCLAVAAGALKREREK